MIASKWTDMVLGLDIHIVLVPPLAVPTPLPMPFVGMVFDPAGMAFAMAFSTVMGGGPSLTLVNGLPATNTGTAATNKLTLPHLPIPGPFAKGIPNNDADLMFGGLKVEIGGSHGVRLGDIALSCSDPIRMPTSTVLVIPMGPLVLVPRPMSPDLMGLVFAAGGKLTGKLFQKAAKGGKKLFSRMRSAQKAGKGWGKLSERLRVREGGKLGRARSAWNRTVCFLTGHPVDVATGRMLTDQVDFELSGAMPLRFERCYDSSLSWRDGPLGRGWSHSLDQAVWPEPGRVVYRAEDGREVEFSTLGEPDRVLASGQSLYHPIERLTLRSLGRGRYEVEEWNGLIREFAPVTGGRISRISAKRTRDGNAITYGYDGSGLLAEVTDAGGRRVILEHDEHGRLVRVDVVGTDGVRVTPGRYEYDPAGDLVQATDALGHSWRYEYVTHLMVRETNRNGLSFYFQYDGIGSAARCVRTWGDGGIYDHEISYDTVNRRTLVENSLGQVTFYQMDEAGQVVTVTDALGNKTSYQYDDRNGLKSAEIDPTGAKTEYQYDDRGNCIRSVAPDGATVTFQYDARNLPVGAVDPIGGRWQWGYDSAGRLTGQVDSLGRRMQYHWDGPRLTAMTDPAGQHTDIGYDGQGNLARLRTPDGAEVRWEYDGLGRCVAAIDPRGNAQRRAFDQAGRLVQIDEPDGDVQQLDHDPEGNVVHARDRHHDVRFTFQGMGRVASRTEAGTTVRFEYDSEERLVAVHNELGAVYRFELGPTGEVDVEASFDGVRRRLVRDAAGRVVKAIRPQGKMSQYVYDPAGRVVASTHDDGGSATFAYRNDGALIEAANDVLAIKLERDLMGRVVKDRQGEDWVESSYDALGERVQVRSSKGLAQTIVRNAGGDVTGIQAAKEGQPEAGAFEARITRDILGQELERALPGGVKSRWERDRTGRPVKHEVWSSTTAQRAVAYSWEPGERLRMVIDAVKGPVQFRHDALGNLAAAIYADGRMDLRLPDAVGNLYRAEDRSDRKYNPAGQLLEARGPDGVTSYEYDPEGNLAQKVEPGGRVWRYIWDGAGMLSKVVRPDGDEVLFGYDPLGRRIWKKYRGRTTRWIWDAHVPLHEWVEAVPVVAPDAIDSAARAQRRVADEAARIQRTALLNERPAQGPPASLGTSEAPITWLFEPDTFSPLAKLIGDERYSIITDHLGTPTLMLDAEGRRVWSADIDIYGDLRNVEGDRQDCPFRWPGQYEDTETGLYYTRFRYYDKGSGSFLSADPLRLDGGPNLYAYVPDPLTWLDPFGLKTCKPKKPHVFWSGGGNRRIKAAAEDWAKGHGGQTLEMTGRGSFLEKHATGLDWIEAEPHWRKHSLRFAKRAAKQDEIHVFLNRNGISPRSVWLTVERPAIMKINPNAKIVEHLI